MKEVKFPCDFEKKARAAPPANGAGYPYRISAKDLMVNFRAGALLVDEAETANGLKLEETRANGKRSVKITGTVTTIPDGYEEINIWVCQSGTPVEITVLAKST